MSVTIYHTETGTPLKMAHIIDAKEAIRSGMYSWTGPAPPPPVKAEPPVVEQKTEIPIKPEVVAEKYIDDSLDEAPVEPVSIPKRRIIRK